MKEERIKKIMIDLGYPDSQSIYGALYQVANEVEQEINSTWDINFNNHMKLMREEIRGVIHDVKKLIVQRDKLEDELTQLKIINWQQEVTINTLSKMLTEDNKCT